MKNSSKNTKKSPKTIRLSSEMENVIKTNSDLRNISESAYIRELLKDGLDNSKREELVTWREVKEKLLVAITHVISMRSNLNTITIISKLKEQLPDLFGEISSIVISDYTKSQFEQMIIAKLKGTLKEYINDFEELLISTIIISFTSLLYDTQVFEPYGLSYAVSLMLNTYNL